MENKTISSVICEAMNLVKKLGKSEENKFANYKYASIDDFLEDLRPKLAEVGLAVVSNEVDCTHFKMPEIKKGEVTEVAFCHYKYDFTLLWEGGEYGPISRSVDIRFVGAQTSGQAQSYAEKMFLRSLLKVATGDQDADAQEQGQFQGREAFMPTDKFNEIRDYILGCHDQEAFEKAAERARARKGEMNKYQKDQLEKFIETKESYFHQRQLDEEAYSKMES